MYPIKSPIYQTQQIRELERLAQERFGITGQVMMQRAGKAAFDFMQRRWPQAKKIAVFCGGGNNGGDGYVLALEAHERNLPVHIWQVGTPTERQPDALAAMLACQAAKIEIHTFDEKVSLEHPDVIVDALCGIGLHNNLREEWVAAIKKIHRSQAPIFAIDMPTGVDADTGQILGAAVHASATLTFIGYKLGLLTGSGLAYTGELAVSDLQLPTDLFTLVEPIAEKMHFSSFTPLLKPRSRDWHKGLSGHVLVIGGDAGYTGAPRMVAEAALRVGAGLVSVATKPEHAALINIGRPEIMCHGVNHPEELAPLLAKANVIVIGPGLTQSAWGKALWEHVTTQSLPLVVDADALNLLSKSEMSNENWVLTPHPGEAARLIPGSTADVQGDRLATLKAINKQYGGVCVLKGAGTLILAPTSLPALCDKGNPGMATGGMGDVLSGVIGGLIAQAIPIGEAAKLGVMMHAMAGDWAAKDGERGLLALDLMPFLRRLSNFMTST